MKTIAFFLEEPSAKAMLEGFIKAHFAIDPQEYTLCYSVYEGKQDLENHLERRLKGWRTPNTVFVIMRDQDSGDCRVIKQKLLKKCSAAGRPNAIVRIACRELESFYLGDPAAVEKGLEVSNIVKRSNRKIFNEPDKIDMPSKALKTITKNKYQKIDGSRRISPFLNPGINRSHSFKVLYQSLCQILQNYPDEKVVSP
jgi:hypothetical protein